MMSTINSPTTALNPSPTFPPQGRGAFAAFRLALILFTIFAGSLPHPVVAQQPADVEILCLNLGFNGVYKLGCWTQAAVTLKGGADAFTGAIEITARDPEGVPTVVLSPPDRAVAVVPGQTTIGRLFVRPGQDGAAIQVRVLDDRGRERAKRSFYSGPEPGGEIIDGGLPATNRIVASFGSTRGMGDLLRGESNDNEQLATRTVKIENAADLPLEWFGYESIDALVLTTTKPELYRPLAASTQRIHALVRWVELGGRVVVFCGVDAPELMGPGGLLVALVPGKFDKLTLLRESQPIEAYVNSETALTSGRQFLIEVPRLTDVRGRILAFAGQNGADLPLVIRARQGLGEVTFVALDPDAPPLAEWPGRVNLLRQALQWPAAPASDVAGQGGVTRQGEDLIDRLRRALDGSFEGVKTAPFALVAFLVIIYILLIGPGDYFFVKRVLKRMELTWLTFPLIVLAVATAAYWAARTMKGDQLRVNQVEIVDVDMSTGKARGTVWTHFFSPRVARYNLTLNPYFGDEPLSEPSEPGRPRPRPSRASAPQSLVAWLGSTGFGLDGMQGRRGQTGLFERGYAFSPPLDALLELPAQEWSTKTLVGRWSAELTEPIDANLKALDDDQLAGQLTNRTGVELQECFLMHGDLAYRLPNLADGAVATVDESLQPSSVKTALTHGDAGYELGGSAADVSANRLDADSTDVNRLAIAMMFYEAVGGGAYAQSPNRYQAFVDLSRLLKGDQAVLLARAAGAGSEWIDGETALASKRDRRWVYYRFVIPLVESGQGAGGRGESDGLATKLSRTRNSV